MVFYENLAPRTLDIPRLSAKSPFPVFRHDCQPAIHLTLAAAGAVAPPRFDVDVCGVSLLYPLLLDPSLAAAVSYLAIVALMASLDCPRKRGSKEVLLISTQKRGKSLNRGA